MGEKLKAGQVWVKGDESIAILWSNGTICQVRLRRTKQAKGAPAVRDYGAQPVLGFICLTDLTRDGWSLDAEGHAAAWAAVCTCGNPSGVILESKPPKCADCRRAGGE